MKLIFASLGAMALMAASTLAAPTLPCNPAVQNWANGSGDTCPVFGAGGQKNTTRKTLREDDHDCEEEENPATVY